MRAWARKSGAVVAWVLVVCASYIASIFLASVTVMIVNAFGGDWSTQIPVGALIFRLVIYTYTLLLIGGIVWLRERRLPLHELGFARRMLEWKDIGLALLGAVVYLFVAVVLLSIARSVPGFDSSQAQDIGFTHIYGTERVIAFVVLVMLTPVFEEVIFRGFLYSKLKPIIRHWWIAAVVVSALFGLAHMQWNVAIDVFVLSMVACYLRELTGSIWAGIILHCLKNLIAFIALFFVSTMR